MVAVLPNFKRDIQHVVGAFEDVFTYGGKSCSCAISPPSETQEIEDVGLLLESDIEIVILIDDLTAAGMSSPSVGDFVTVTSSRQGFSAQGVFVNRRQYATSFFVLEGKLGR